MHIGLDKRDEVGAGLADNEVVHVEQFSYAPKRRITIRIGGVCPMAEIDSVRWRPWYDVAMCVFAEHSRLPTTI